MVFALYFYQTPNQPWQGTPPSVPPNYQTPNQPWQGTPPTVPPNYQTPNQPNQFNPQSNIKPQKKTGCMGCLLFIIIAFFIFALIGGIVGGSKKSDSSGNAATTPAATPTVAGTPVPTLTPKQSFVKTMAKESGLKEKTVGNLYSVINKKLGYKKIEFYGENEEIKSAYDILADDYLLLVFIDDLEMLSISNGTYVMYSGGKVKYTKENISEREISSSDASMYYEIAKMIIKSNLMSPSSAKFPSYGWSNDEISMQRNGDYVAVWSYVDADNSFGANIRSEYVVEFQILDMETYNYLPVYIYMDGEESGTFKELD